MFNIRNRPKPLHIKLVRSDDHYLELARVQGLAGIKQPRDLAAICEAFHSASRKGSALTIRRTVGRVNGCKTDNLDLCFVDVHEDNARAITEQAKKAFCSEFGTAHMTVRGTHTHQEHGGNRLTSYEFSFGYA